MFSHEHRPSQLGLSHRTRPCPLSRSFHTRIRSTRGQALAEGSAFLVVFTMVAVGLLLLILCTGTAEFYHLKLLNVAQVMARNVVADTFWQGNQYKAKPASLTEVQKEKVAQLLDDVGLPSDPSKWSVEVADDITGQNCIVKLQVNGLPLPGGGILPSLIGLSATAVESWSVDKPPFSVAISTSIGEVFVPAYRPNNASRNGTTIEYALSADGKRIAIFNPDYTVPQLGNPLGTGYLGVNYAGFGSSGQTTGTPTYTGSMLCSFAPFAGTIQPMPAPSAYPEN